MLCLNRVKSLKSHLPVIRIGCPLLLPVGERTAVEFLPKSAMETRLLAIADAISNFLDPHFRVSQQVGSLFKSFICEKNIQAQAGLGLEQVAQP